MAKKGLISFVWRIQEAKESCGSAEGFSAVDTGNGMEGCTGNPCKEVEWGQGFFKEGAGKCLGHIHPVAH